MPKNCHNAVHNSSVLFAAGWHCFRSKNSKNNRPTSGVFPPQVSEVRCTMLGEYEFTPQRREREREREREMKERERDERE